MPTRKVTGLPRLKKGERLLLIKESGRGKFQTIKLKKKRKRRNK